MPERHSISLVGKTVTATGVAHPDAAGFVLAGGRSSRMGADKALVHFAGKPLVAHAVDLLRAAGLTATIAGARSPLDEFAPVVEDSHSDAGPLGGICSALASTLARWAIFISVDLPLLPVSLPVYLLHRARITGSTITVPSVNGFAQTFPAVVVRSALPALQAELDAGRGGCFAAFQAAIAVQRQAISVFPVELLVQSGHLSHPHGLPPARWFLNINAPADLQRAEAHIGRKIA